MSCKELDLKAYALGEASASERKSVESHAASCIPCRTELDSLGTLQTAMMSWAHENMNAEPPRRIAFVSDKVFEPRWWQRWNLAQLLVPAALSAVVAFAVVRTQTPPPAPQAVVNNIDIEKRIDAAVAERVDGAVKLALAESDARLQKETLQLRATERLMRSQSTQAAEIIAAMQTNYETMQKRNAGYLHASLDLGARQ
jgi:hypothetical protein